MNLLSSASVFSFFTLISRILGYVRDILIAIFLGASIFADAFFVAFRLPNTFRRLFAEGTFNAAFIPSYTSAKIEDKKKGKKFADDVLSSLLLILLFIVTIVEIFTPYLIYIIAPGFLEDQIKFNLAVELTRITFPFLLFVSLSSFFSGILNSNNKFAAAAGAPAQPTDARAADAAEPPIHRWEPGPAPAKPQSAHGCARLGADWPPANSCRGDLLKANAWQERVEKCFAFRRAGAREVVTQQRSEGTCGSRCCEFAIRGH